MSLENRSPHYEDVEIEAAAAVVARQLITLNDVNVFSEESKTAEDIAAGNTRYMGIRKSPKVSAAKEAIALAVSEAIYYIVASNTVTNVVGTNVLIGSVARAAAAGDAEVLIDFDGTLAFAKA